MVGEINKNLKSKIIHVYGNQRLFAQEIDMPEGTVSRVIRGRYNLTVDEQQQWADALCTSKTELFDN